MKRAPWRGPALAAGAVALGLLVSYALAPGAGALLPVLLLAVIAGAWEGGSTSGLLATVLAVAGALIVPGGEPMHAPGSAPMIRLMAFAVAGVVVSLLSDWQRRRRHHLEEQYDQYARLAEVMHSIGIGHWYSDLPTQQMHWDAQCKAHFGVPENTAITLDVFLGCIHPDDRTRFQGAAERAIFSHTSCDIDFRVLLREGGIRWLRALGRGFYDRAGRPTRFDGITVDITRQKEAEAALAEANRLKDDFLATLSHELRTPLNAVLGWARMLAAGSVPPHRVAHAVSVIERNAQSQARLVEELLDLSRIETGQLRLHIEPVDAAAQVQSALEAVRPAADARRIELVSSLDPAARWVTADPDRLRQVIWNLLSNAVKFTPADGRVIVELAPAGSGCRLAVIDTGCGIDPEFLPRVFDRFSQSETPEARAVRGLGIGLAIVRELVEAHGGSVTAASDGAGRGATFTITLPGRIEVPFTTGMPSVAGSYRAAPDEAPR